MGDPSDGQTEVTAQQTNGWSKFLTSIINH